MRVEKPHWPPPGRADAFLVQLRGDALWRLASGVVAKDAAHHLGLSRVDGPVSAHGFPAGVEPLDDVVAVGVATAGLALLDAASEAPAGLVGEVLEEQGVHGPLQPHVQRGDLAFGQGDDLHASEGHALIEARDVLLVSGKPVHGLGQHDLKPPGLCIRDQGLDAAAQQRGAGDGVVGILLHHRPTLALGIEPEDPELVGDRGVALVVVGIAGVERDLHDVSLTFRSAGAPR